MATSESSRPLAARPGGGYAVALGVVTLLLLLPILTVPFPPLVDYPNHLAEGYILAHIGDMPRLQANYETAFAPFPNLAATLVLQILMLALPPLAAGKAVLALIILLWVAGAHRIGRALTGRPSWLAVPVALIAYNSSLYYGFLNYAMSIPVFLITFAAWLEWRSSMRWSRLAVLTGLACLCYLSHFSAFAFLGMGCVLTLAVDSAASRRLRPSQLLSLLPLVPPVGLFLAYMGGSGEMGGVRWGSFVEKSLSLLSPFIGYDRRMDAGVVMLAATACFLALRGRPRPAVRRGALACGLAYVAAIFATPRVILTSSGADIRFALPALICLLFALDFRLPARTARLCFSLLVIALCLKVFGVWGAWAHQSRDIACSVRSLEGVEEGARILPIYLRSADLTVDKNERGLIHVAHYATLLRQAFVPSLFTFSSQQLVRMKNPPSGGTSILPEDADPAGVDWQAIRESYDYVWACRFTPAFRARVTRIADEVSGCPQCGLWKIQPPPAAP